MTEHKTMLVSVCPFLVKVISSMSNGYRLPDPLPWAALAASLAAAEDRLARLDERLRGSPIRAAGSPGPILPTAAPACGSTATWFRSKIWCCMTRIGTSTPRPAHSSRAQAMLRARRRIAAADPGWALTPAGLASLRGRAGEGTRTPNRTRATTRRAWTASVPATAFSATVS